jgi:integrase
MANAPPAIKQLKCPPPPTDFLTTDEAARLLAHAEGTIREMILLALRTGMRQGEIRGLQWEAIDWENRILTVRHSLCEYTRSLTSPKSNRERHVPLADDLYDVLCARRKSTGYVFTNERGRPFPQYSHYLALQKVRERAGLRKIGWHKLRHTFATHLAAKVSLRTVQELLGHSTITMTMRYSHVSAPDLRAAIDLLSAPSPSLPFGQQVGNLTAST